MHSMASRCLPSFFGPAAILLVLSMTASAQKKPGSEDSELAAIRMDIEASYAPLESALKSDKAFCDRLTAELKAASSEKDPARRKAALAGYSSKYAAEYGKFAAKAGLRMDQVVAGLNARYKGYEFQAANTYGIVFGKKRPKRPTKPGTPNSTGGVRTIQLPFNIERDEDCGGNAGGYVITGDRSLTASNWAGLVGGCSIGAELTHQSTLPTTARNIKLLVSYTISVEGGAIGILGAASSRASGNVIASADNRLLSIDWQGCFESVIAPLLWSASYNDGVDQMFEVDLVDYLGKRLKLSSMINTRSSAYLCCGTGADAKMNFFKAELVIVD